MGKTFKSPETSKFFGRNNSQESMENKTSARMNRTMHSHGKRGKFENLSQDSSLERENDLN
jgi:hypothetical protein